MKIFALIERHLVEAGLPEDRVQLAMSQIKHELTTQGYRITELRSRTEVPRKKGPCWHGYSGPIVRPLSSTEWKKVRARILSRDGHKCSYCGQSDKYMTADHIVPLSRGGSNDDENLTACCRSCNASKRDLLPSEWKGRVSQ